MSTLALVKDKKLYLPPGQVLESDRPYVADIIRIGPTLGEHVSLPRWVAEEVAGNVSQTVTVWSGRPAWCTSCNQHDSDYLEAYQILQNKTSNITSIKKVWHRWLSLCVISKILQPNKAMRFLSFWWIQRFTFLLNKFTSLLSMKYSEYFWTNACSSQGEWNCFCLLKIMCRLHLGWSTIQP